MMLDGVLREWLGAGRLRPRVAACSRRHPLADGHALVGRNRVVRRAGGARGGRRPICVAGFTDSHWLRQSYGAVAYGFFPMKEMEAELANRLVHSADERITVADLELGVEFLRHAARAFGR